MTAKFSETKVSIGLAAAISELKYQLQREFNIDYAFLILGNGHLIAASNKKDGIVHPSTT